LDIEEGHEPLNEETEAMRNAQRIAVLSGRGRLAVVVLALGLATAIPGRSLGGEPAGAERIGQRVVPKHKDFTIRQAEDGPQRAGKIAVYRIEEVKGAAVRLMPDGGPSGWADSAQVVPLEHAVEFFTDAIGKSPRDPHNYAMRAMVLLVEREDPVHAMADSEGAIRIDPKYAFARRVRGAILAATQDLDKAIADFNEAIRTQPNEPDAYRDRGVARISRQDFDGAIADFREAVRLDPSDSSTYICRATAWLAKNDDVKAMADFDEAIRLEPRNADAYFLRGSLRGQKGQLDAAIADFDQIIKFDKAAFLAYEGRGTAWRHKREFEHAIADFSEAIRLEPRNPGAYVGRGLTYREQHQDDKAIADLDQAIRLDPENTDAYGVRGDAWSEKKDFARAIVDFSRVLELDPQNAWAYASRGIAHAESQHYDKAVADLDKALQIDPSNPEALNGMAWFRATCPDAKYRNGSQAVAAATKACEVTGWKEPGLLDTLAAADAESNDFASALKWQAKAIELETDAKEKADYSKRLALYKDKKAYREIK
jgi:tetratricopeptide (TPR) repeat protein